MTDFSNRKLEFKTLENGSEIVSAWRFLADSFEPPLDVTVTDLDGLCEKFARHAVNVVCLVDDELAGAVSFYANDEKGHIAYVSEIASAARFRGCGVGSSLLKECLRISRDAGMREVRLEVRENNETARAFYVAKGFKVVDTREEGVLLMAKAL